MALPEESVSHVGLRSRIAVMLVGRWWPLVAAGLGVLLTAPSLGAGLALDDYIHRTFLLTNDRFPWDLFAFLNGDEQLVGSLIRDGVIPWWTLEDLRVAFFRPLASLTHWVDYQLWPDSAALMHAHSLLWFGACIACVGCVYRRLLGATVVAGLAALLFAFDEAHQLPVAWLANRNVLPAFFFGMLAVIAHDRWRRDDRRWGAVAGPIFLALSVCSAEAGVATMAYVLAHAMFIDRASPGRRVLALVPYVVVIGLWSGVYRSLGYGVWGSGFYCDPTTEPLLFLSWVARNGPILLLLQWVMPPSMFDGFMAMFGPTLVLTAVACVVLLVVGLIVVRVLPRDRMTRFWAVGMLVALLPVCATIPMTRLLLFGGVGAFGLIARFLCLVFPLKPQPAGFRRSRLAVILGVIFVMVHIAAPPVWLPLATRHTIPPDVVDRLFITAPMDEAVEHQTVVVVNSPSVFHARHSADIRAAAGQPIPRAIEFLCPSWSAVRLTRSDAHTLIVRPETGYLVRPLDVLFRGAQHAMPLGTRVRLEGIDVEITALTADGRPGEATFRFAKPLEDPSWRWLQYEDKSYRPFAPPAVGEVVELAAPEL